MATGGWSLRLRPETPRSIRDAITPFSMIAMFPSATPTGATDANMLAAARYVGVVTSPGPQLAISGPGLAAWLGQNGISYDTDGTGILPETLAESTAGSTLNAWLDDIIIPGTPFSRGTTGPAGTMKGAFQWITPRDMLETVTAYFGAEWRIRPNLQLDVAAYTTLYGSTPSVIITRNATGRDMSYTSIAAQVESAVDVADYASRVVLLANSGRGSSGSASGYRGPEGGFVKATRVIDSPDVPPGAESATAASYVGLLNSARREVRLSTAHYDTSGDIGVGSLVSFFDPENGIIDTTATPILFRGEAIRPVTVRCLGLEWPWRLGMGCALRSHDGSSVTWTDLTPYIVPEDGDATIEIGAAQRFIQGDALDLRADLRPQMQWTKWQTYTPTWDSFGAPTPVIGNGTLTGAYRRMGTVLEVRVTMVAGSTTTFGTNGWVFYLPSGITGKTQTGLTQMGRAVVLDAGLAEYACDVSLASGGSFMALVTGSPWANVGQGTFFTAGTGDTINITATFEVDP